MWSRNYILWIQIDQSVIKLRINNKEILFQEEEDWRSQSNIMSMADRNHVFKSLHKVP